MAESFHLKMKETISSLLEYLIIMAMNSVGLTIGSRLMAENRDVTCFIYHRTLFQIMDGLIKSPCRRSRLYLYGQKRTQSKSYYAYMLLVQTSSNIISLSSERRSVVFYSTYFSFHINFQS